MIAIFKEDVERWINESRNDILEKLKFAGDEKQPIIEAWFNPKTRREYIYCPFLKKKGSDWSCSIHKTKPKMCRDYICRKYKK